MVHELPTDLLNFSKASSQRHVFHYTSYTLAALIPAAVLFGSPISDVSDHIFSIVIPVHFHLGLRSVIIDYVHDRNSQRIALIALAGMTALTAASLVKLNLTDIGITNSVKALWIDQTKSEESEE